MATLTVTPSFPAPQRPARLRFDLQQTGANFVRVWCVSAPTGSKLRADLDTGERERIPFYQGGGGVAREHEFTPEVGGAYLFVAQEYAKGASDYGGGYEGDPNANPSETALGSETNLTLRVGKRLVQTIGVAPDTATLVLHVWGDRVRSTSVAVHGERTPAIVSPATPKASIAAGATTVQAALASLVGEAAATALDSPSAVTDDLINRFNAHRTQGSIHASNDTDNSVRVSLLNPTSPAGVTESANELFRMLRNHMRNAKDEAPQTGSTVYHGSPARADLGNLMISSPASDPATTMALIADMHRAYEAHRASTAHHSPADTTNVASALPKLFLVHRHFVDSLRAATPSTPSTEHEAVTVLVHGAGFSEEPL
jgi:hypothetical protein